MVAKEFVGKVFSSVASKYDVMNDVMSFGLHRCWKREFCDLITADLSSRINPTFLDIASGSGDIIEGVLKKSIHGTYIASDINEDMLENAKKRLGTKASYEVIDCLEIPKESGSIDVISCSFGARNFENLQKGVDEIHRVLKTGGRFFCMEFSSQNVTKFHSSTGFYVSKIIPKMGKIIHEEWPYQYLSDSINGFPNESGFQQVLSNFSNVSFKTFLNGLVMIAVATV